MRLQEMQIPNERSNQRPLEKLYYGGASTAIKNKINEYAIGLYSDYSNDQYCVTAGNEVSKPENDELSVKIIPAGKYAKFSVHGHMEKQLPRLGAKSGKWI